MCVMHLLGIRWLGVHVKGTATTVAPKSCKFKVLLPSEVFVAMLRVLIEGL